MRGGLRSLAGIRPEMRRFLVGSACMGAAHSIPWSLLPLYLDRLGLSKAELGVVQSAESWGRVLIALPAALLLARKRTPPVLVVTSLVGAVAYFVLPWGGALTAFLFLNGLRGFCDAVHHVAIAPFLFRHTSIAERALVFGLYEAVHTLAAVAGSFLCGRGVATLSAALDDETRAMAFVLSSAGVLGLVAAACFAGIRERVDPGVVRPPLLATLRGHVGLVARFAAPQFVLAVGAGLVIPFLGLYFQDRFGLAPQNVANLYACGQVMMTAGFLVSPFLLRRAGFVRGMIGVELASIPFFLLLAFTTSFPVAVIAFLIRGALMNASHPLFKNFMMRASPDGLRELQNGILSLLWGIGWVVGPAVGGRILDTTGGDYAPLMLATVAMYLAASTATFLLLRPLEAAARDEV